MGIKHGTGCGSLRNGPKRVGAVAVFDDGTPMVCCSEAQPAIRRTQLPARPRNPGRADATAGRP